MPISYFGIRGDWHLTLRKAKRSKNKLHVERSVFMVVVLKHELANIFRCFWIRSPVKKISVGLNSFKFRGGKGLLIEINFPGLTVAKILPIFSGVLKKR